MSTLGTALTSKPLTDPALSGLKTRSAWMDWLLCFSWANISLSRVWSEVLTYSPASSFFMKVPPGPQDIGATMTSVFLLSIAAWVVVFCCRRMAAGAVILHVLSLVAWLIPLNAIRFVASTAIPGLFGYVRQPALARISPTIILTLLTAGAVGLVWAIVALRIRRIRVGSTLCSLTLPLIIVTWGQGVYRITHPAPPIPAPQLAGPLPSSAEGNGPRVVWIIFDEWDYRLSFDQRPPTLQLPVLDRLRAETVFSTNALPPAHDTAPSISSLLTMRKVEGLEAVDHSTARLLPSGDDISSADNVFRKARALGKNAGVVGWYLPYCRIFGSALSECERWETDALRISHGANLSERVVSQLRSLVETGVLSPFGQSMATKQSAVTYQALMNAAAASAANANLDLVFVHMPVPHSPFFYDRHTRTFTGANSYVRGYVDHLALVDESVDRTRKAMERSGVWARSTFIISADHHYRNSQAFDGKTDLRVPFIVKLAQQSRAEPIDSPVNTIRTGDLVLAALQGKLTTTDDVRRVLGGWQP